MFEGCAMVSTAQMPRGEWLELRRTGIGGSDAAAIVGLNAYATPYTVYLDKLGLLPEKEDTEAMRQGRDLEEYVARRFMEKTGKKVRRCNYMIRNPRYPFALADIDFRIVSENAGLECKTTSTLDLAQFNGVEFPGKYYGQCVHYLAVTGADRWYLAVLVLGRGFFVFTLERDEAEIAALMEAEGQFWHRVEERNPPSVTGHDADTEAVGTIWADSANDETVDLLDMEPLFRQLGSLEESLAITTALKNQTVNKIKARMQTAGSGVCGPYSCTWKTQQRRSLDMDALREDFPDIPFDDYMRVTKSRPFKWKFSQ